MVNTFTDNLVKYCSPVLAGIKTANMFTFFDNFQNISTIIDSYNKVFNSLGIYFYILNSNKKGSLIYVCRLDMLKKDLQKKYIKNFMTKEGYNINKPEQCIQLLSYKIKSKSEFPHEIGLFLSYPIYDVLGFIENKGNNFKYCGYWKVYSNENYARQIFYKYKKYTNLYREKFDKEKNLLKLVTK